MLCISIGDYGLEECMKSLRKCEKLAREYPEIIAEIRMDLCGLSDSDVRGLFSSAKIPLLATCRKRTLHLLTPAITSGATYIDIDLLSSDSSHQALNSLLVKRKRVKKILSFHNYNSTPSLRALKKVYTEAVNKGADIVKIATMANSVYDAERVLSLYNIVKSGELGKQVPLIAFTMGEKGAYSRVEALNLGAPLMFCSLTDKNQMAPGQFSYVQMRKMFKPVKVEGELTIPASKSIAQRAIVAAALAQGESEFHNFGRCKDIDAAIGVAKQIGAKVYSEDGTLYVRGNGFPFKNKDAGAITSAIMMPDTISVFVGESGLLSRLCIPIMAQMKDSVTISGEGSLMGRKMYGCKDSLEFFKAKCLLTAEETLPAVVSGPLIGGKATISGNKGSQLISGLLMALPLSSKDSELTVESPASVPYIYMTVDVIKKFGVNISYQEVNGSLIFSIPGKQKYCTTELSFEGDWSSAANFLVAGAVFGNLFVRGLDMDSYQPDKAIFNILQHCNADIALEERGIRVRRSHLSPFEYDATDSPDLFPILVVLAAFCEGESTIHGVERLKNKESDRDVALYNEFKKMGLKIEIEGDDMIVNGISYTRRVAEDQLLSGGSFMSYNDHRIVMALKIAALGCQDKVNIDRIDCVDKSFPLFDDMLSSIIVK